MLFHRYFIQIYLILQTVMVYGQQPYTIEGKIWDGLTNTPLSECKFQLEGTNIHGKPGKEGTFVIHVPEKGDYLLKIFAPGYITVRLPITVTDDILNLGVVRMERDLAIEKIANSTVLTDSELLIGEQDASPSPFLQATRDVFLNRATFDFGQVFFRTRGLGAENAMVFLNGIPMNRLHHGRAEWNHWGGLNDVVRNQESTYGLDASNHGFGGVLGVTHIDTRPSKLRSGVRLSSSQSNRSYTGRFMVTHTDKKEGKGLFYSISASRRWGAEGSINGTLYDAYAFFGALEYRLNTRNTIGVTGIYSPNRRGRSAPITEEVFNLVGRDYNPHWGTQNGAIRNARERKIKAPIMMFNHYYESKHFRLNTGIAYQSGIISNSRLGYYNAPNPDPTYYRYLPSFYLNSPIGANFIGANLAREGFLQAPQLQWSALYSANTGSESNGRASYILYDDVSEEEQISLNNTVNVRFNDRMKLDFGATYRILQSANYARIEDLLGADFHEDIDVFSNTRNEINGDVLKRTGDIFNYRYQMEVSKFDAFAQIKIDKTRWNAFVAGTYSSTAYQREGLFQNERFLMTSLGKSKALQFSNYGVKGGAFYTINGRHRLGWHGIYSNKAPLLQNTFINPRENNGAVPNIKSEKVTGTTLEYAIRLPKWKGKFTGFYTRFQDVTDINFFFVESGVGSDFVQEVITDLDKLHLGGELGLEYKITPEVKLTAVAAIGKYVYASNPNITINFDTAGNAEDFINPDGNIDLGIARIKDYKLAQGPQKAFALGVEYRNPKYWWLGVTTNYLTSNYAAISTITRTQSFLLNPDTQLPFPNATPENVEKILRQESLDMVYLLNLIGGKSWLVKDTYISIFASVSNVFDTVFRTGGFEQSRNGNFGQLSQDNLGSSPSFGPKYWYGRGRTYFINLAVSF